MGLNNRSAVWVHIAAAGLAILAAGCGSTGGAPAKATQSGSTTTSTTQVSSPRLSVSPSRGLIGGQELQVSVSGFPVGATVAVFECAGSPPTPEPAGCGGPGASYLYTGTGSGASGGFIAEPSAGSGQSGTTPLSCRDRCVLVAVAIKVGAGGAPRPAPMATAPLSFAATTGPDLAYWSLEDLTWVSTSQGWVLATQPCSTGICNRLAETTDGGQRWQALPDPPADTQEQDCAAVACVSGVRFATTNVGYLFGPALLITSDAGEHWQSMPGLQTETLAVADRNVYRVAYDHTGCPGPCNPSLQEAPIGSNSWRTLIDVLASPARSGSAQIVTSGSTLLVALYGSLAGPVNAEANLYRSFDGGTSWQRQSDPCAGRGAPGEEDDLVDVTSAAGGFFAGLCTPHAATGDSFVVTSNDDAQHWQTAGTLKTNLGLGELSAASPSTLAACCTQTTDGNTSSTTGLMVSTDDGQHWTTVATDTQPLQPQDNVTPWLGFETSQVGRWIDDPHNVWTTTDSGQQWIQIPFQ